MVLFLFSFARGLYRGHIGAWDFSWDYLGVLGFFISGTWDLFWDFLRVLEFFGKLELGILFGIFSGIWDLFWDFLDVSLFIIVVRRIFPELYCRIIFTWSIEFYSN